MTTVAAAEAATAPPNTAAGKRPSSMPVCALITTSVRELPLGASSPTVITPGQARTDMIAVPAGADSVVCHSTPPRASA